jgi:hypothetical protein
MEALADSDDIAVTEKPRRARIMAHRSSAGDIDYTAMQYFKVLQYHSLLSVRLEIGVLYSSECAV